MIPEGWRTARLDTIADLLSGGTPSKGRPEWWTGPIPWASPKDMKRLRLADTADHITEEAAEAGSRVVPVKTIFVVIRGMILAKALPVAIAEVPMAFNQDMKAIIPRAGVDPDYLLYALASRRDALAGQIGTSAHGTRRLGSSSLEALEIPLPPLNEQRAIGYFLTKVQTMADVQATIAAALQRAKSVIMAKLFREGLRGESLKTTELGELPESWNVVRLGDYCDVVSGGTPRREVSEYWNGAIPWVKTGEIAYRPIRTTAETITDAGLRASAAKILPAGTLLMAMYGQGVTRGRVAFLEIEAATNQACAGLNPRDGLDAQFLYAFCAFAYNGIRALGHGANQKNLSAELIRDIRLPLPECAEQVEIGRIVRALDTRIVVAEHKRDALSRLFRSMLDALLTGKVRLSPRLIGKLSLRATAATPKPHGKVDDRLIEEAVRRIVEAIAPEKIILFGSAARGEMDPDSDLDFLVIKQGMAIRDAHRAIRDRLRGIGIPIDTVVVTPDMVERYGDIIGHIVRPALREGRVVYAA
ncbi:MAG: restriction endonuclease subunit S [Candidatus Rokubacteria bacterium]|nr:restriction endonuclease subunit S [Candidatus Rokubacteria bacterium]